MIWLTRFDSAADKVGLRRQHEVKRGGAKFVTFLIGVHALFRQIARDGRDPDAFLAAVQ